MPGNWARLLWYKIEDRPKKSFSFSAILWTLRPIKKKWLYSWLDKTKGLKMIYAL